MAKLSTVFGILAKMAMERIKNHKFPVFDATPLILGPPGIGKSEMTKRFAQWVAKQMGLQFIEYTNQVDIDKYPRDKILVHVDVRLTAFEPPDLGGIPIKVGNKFRYLPPDWAEILATGPGVLFLDEITMVQRPDMQSAMVQLLRDRRSGFQKFDDRVIVIAAGNPPNMNALAVDLPSVVTDRLAIFEVAPPSVDEWVTYMREVYGSNWDLRVASFLYKQPAALIIDKIPRETMQQYPTPRSWTYLARMLNRDMNEREIRIVASSVVGKQYAAQFAAWATVALPDVQTMLSDPNEFINLSTDQQFLAVAAIAAHFNQAVSNGNIDIEMENASNFFNAIYNKTNKDMVIRLLYLLVQSARVSLVKKIRSGKINRAFLGEISKIKQLANQLL